MCRTDSFSERGIVRMNGYGSEHWRVEPDFALPILPRLGELGVLLEPASVRRRAATSAPSAALQSTLYLSVIAVVRAWRSTKCFIYEL